MQLRCEERFIEPLLFEASKVKVKLHMFVATVHSNTWNVMACIPEIVNHFISCLAIYFALHKPTTYTHMSLGD